MRGPGEVREALARHATAETLALYDRQVEQATKDALERNDVAPLAKVLVRWWLTAQVASGARPEGLGLQMVSQEEVVADWQRHHPGETLNAA